MQPENGEMAAAPYTSVVQQPKQTKHFYSIARCAEKINENRT